MSYKIDGVSFNDGELTEYQGFVLPAYKFESQSSEFGWEYYYNKSLITLIKGFKKLDTIYRQTILPGGVLDAGLLEGGALLVVGAYVSVTETTQIVSGGDDLIFEASTIRDLPAFYSGAVESLEIRDGNGDLVKIVSDGEMGYSKIQEAYTEGDVINIIEDFNGYLDATGDDFSISFEGVMMEDSMMLVSGNYLVESPGCYRLTIDRDHGRYIFNNLTSETIEVQYVLY